VPASLGGTRGETVGHHVHAVGAGNRRLNSVIARVRR
jgi:hypothetical protein